MVNGKLYDAKLVTKGNDEIPKAFTIGAANLTKLSLGSGYIIPTAAPHLIWNAFSNLGCAAIASDYEFPALSSLKSAAAKANAAAAAKEAAAARARA